MEQADRKVQDETDHRKGIVPDLDNLNRRKFSHQCKNQNSKHNKEQNVQTGKKSPLQSGKYTDFKYDLLYQITVFQQTV
mgnify:CR=1 FL=1